MNLIDLLVLLLFVVGLVAGARAGFLGPVLGLIGAVGGFALALVAASVFQEQLVAIEQPMRALVTVLGIGAFVLTGEATGAAIGTTMSRGIEFSPLRPFDAVGGAVVGVAHVVLLVWVLSGMLASGMAPSIAAAARDSVAVRIATERLPAPTTIAGRLVALLGTTDLPPLFAGIEPPPAAPVALPSDAETSALAESALGSTARVTSSGCGAGLSVGSGFFVSRTHVVTNAHVVAGSTDTTVTIGGTVHNATVVAYDSAGDLALLYVPGASAPPLTLSTEAPVRGTTAAALGYPGGGPLTVTAAGVTATHDIFGPDIYGAGQYSRNVVELRAEIRRGNSGGPLVIAPGVVGGVVFGASRASPEVGYAIGSDEAVERIGPYIGATAAVGTGACL
ncbi:MAG TPA: MarP family serine protease [Candidatus Limnocylindria bacterium]|jgi:S1-C subfamily serine protease